MNRITDDATTRRLTPTTIAQLRITRARFPAPRFILDDLLAALDDPEHSVRANVCLLLGNVRPVSG
jgi:hypothetical protein